MGQGEYYNGGSTVPWPRLVAFVPHRPPYRGGAQVAASAIYTRRGAGGA
jgi:hypothetical protein